MHARVGPRAATTQPQKKETPVLQRLARGCDFLQPPIMAGTGFELPTNNPRYSRMSDKSGTECGALGAQNDVTFDPQLAAVLDVWLALPAAIKAGILAILHAVK